MHLSERLKQAMLRAGMTQAALARACKVSKPSVNAWVNGDGKTKFLKGENLLAAARALNVSATWLATGNGPMQPDDGPLQGVPSEFANITPFPVLTLEAVMEKMGQYLAKIPGHRINEVQSTLSNFAARPMDHAEYARSLKSMLPVDDNQTATGTDHAHK